MIRAAHVLFMLVSIAAAQERLTLVENGETKYEIVVEDKAFPTTQLAAEELRRFVKLATDATLPIVGWPSAGRRQIYISSTDKLNPDGFAIQVQGEDLYLRGCDSNGEARTVSLLEPIHRGTCNAVYELLERFVGVRWFWSDDLGQIVPRPSRIVIPADFVIKQEPAFDYRALAYGPAGSFDGDWARRQRLGSAATMHHGHNLQKLLPVADWARRGHPEYAALRGSERRTKGASGDSGGHLCLGNDAVVRIVAQEVETFFASHPKRTMYSIAPPDGSTVCICELCTRYDVPDYKVPDGEHKGWPVITDRTIHFYNSVAEIVAQQYPFRHLGGTLYMDYLYPPRLEKAAHPMLALVVSPNRALELWDDKTLSFYRELFNAWGSFHRRVYAHDTCFLSRRTFALPTPLGDRAVDFIRLLESAKIRGAYLYIGPTWETLGSDSYVLARLLWNPKADVEAIRREYFGLLYGPGDKAVAEYFDEATACWRRATVASDADVAPLAEAFHRSKPGAREAFARLLIGYGANLPALERHLSEAERLVLGDPTLERRVERVRDNFTLTVATIQGLQSVVAYERDPAKNVAYLSALDRAINARETLLKRVGLTYGFELKERLRFADENVESPLRFSGYYHKLAAP